MHIFSNSSIKLFSWLLTVTCCEARPQRKGVLYGTTWYLILDRVLEAYDAAFWDDTWASGVFKFTCYSLLSSQAVRLTCFPRYSETLPLLSSRKHPTLNENLSDGEFCIHLLLGIPQACVWPEHCRLPVRYPSSEFCISTAPTLMLPEQVGAA